MAGRRAAELIDHAAHECEAARIGVARDGISSTDRPHPLAPASAAMVFRHGSARPPVIIEWDRA
jgi:hypothetical protein